MKNITEIRSELRGKFDAALGTVCSFDIICKDNAGGIFIRIFSDNTKDALMSWHTSDVNYEDILIEVDAFLKEIVEATLYIKHGLMYSKGKRLFEHAECFSNVVLDLHDEDSNENYKMFTMLTSAENICFGILKLVDGAYVEIETSGINNDLQSESFIPRCYDFKTVDIISKMDEFVHFASTLKYNNLYDIFKLTLEVSAKGKDLSDIEFDEYADRLEIILIEIVEQFMIETDKRYSVLVDEDLDDEVCSIVDDVLFVMNHSMWVDIERITLTNDDLMIFRFDDSEVGDSYKYEHFVVRPNEDVLEFIKKACNGSVDAETVWRTVRYIVTELDRNVY